MSELKLTVRDLEDSWACKHAQGELTSDERVAEIRTLLNEIQADAWDEGAAAVNGRLTLTVAGTEVIDWESEEPSNPYRKEQDDE